MLRRKLARDLWRLRGQGFTIALLVGCGIASFVTAVTASSSLEASLADFYADARFADVFVHLERAPLPVLDRLRDLPGVAAVEGRVVGDFRMQIDGGSEPVVARFVSLRWPAETQLDATRIIDGRQVQPGSADEVVVSVSFAEAWGLKPGATITTVIDGRRARLRMVGTAVSPEFVYSLAPRTGLPDPRHFGVVWMDGDALAKADGMVGAFDDAVIQLGAGADEREAIDRVDALLEPYGGLGAVGRGDQSSHRLVTQKVQQLSRMAVALPLVFLGVAAFLLNVLLSRIVGTQREQIATLKALGYRTRELAWHYLELAGAICAVGAVLGVALGLLGADGLLVAYARYFRLPALVLRLDAWPVAVGVLVACAAALAGTLRAVGRAVSVPPAEAMRPEAPPTYRASPLDRVYRFLAPATRMVLRDATRRPLRLLLSAWSIALATAIVVAGSAAVDSLTEALGVIFEVSRREDVTVTLDRARPWRAVSDLAHVPGVVAAEGERVVPVRLRAGPRSRTTAILGLLPDMDMHRLLDTRMRTLAVASSGLSLSRPLGEWLGVDAGDELEVDVLEADRPKARVRVAALIDDFLGLSGYMDAAALERLLGETAAANQVLLEVDRRDLDDVAHRLDDMPAVAGVSRPALDRGLVYAEVADSFVMLEVILALFAAIIAVGVVYNNARIALELRSRDLATLRILGFRRTELAVVLLGEQAIQVVLGVAFGLPLGRWMGAATLSAIDRELIRIPPSLSPASQVAAACVVVLAAMLSALRVRRQSDRLDLVAVLKARD